MTAVRIPAEHRCPELDCELTEDHHGPHQRGLRQWHSDVGRHPKRCPGCESLVESEEDRLRAGGELRPGQRVPEHLRGGRGSL